MQKDTEERTKRNDRTEMRSQLDGEKLDRSVCYREQLDGGKFERLLLGGDKSDIEKFDKHI